jgi:leucine-rich repeat protein SHOC2
MDFLSLYENAVLSLSEHALNAIPDELYIPDLQKKLRTLDLSSNKLTSLGQLHTFSELKSLNLEGNQLAAGSLGPVASMSKIQNLSCANNRLGQQPSSTAAHGKAKAQPSAPAAGAKPIEAISQLPPSLRQINLSSNFLSSVPRCVLSSSLNKLEKLDLSDNQLVVVPVEISNLTNLEEIKVDNNMIVSLPEAMGSLRKLKVLSLRNNKLNVTSTNFSEQNPQPIPASLLTDTPLIDLNLHGNQMTNTQLNEFAGFQQFLDRRQKVKSKTMANLSVCGLK